MFGIAIKTERSPYLKTLNDCRCRVRINRVWTQTEIDKRSKAKNEKTNSRTVDSGALKETE